MKEIDNKQLQLALAKLEKQFGKNTVILGDIIAEDVNVHSTGNFRLDIALGVGGLPKGRITEIFGPEALGKSLLAYGLVADCQRKGELALYIDAECDVHPEWAEKNGVDMKSLYLSQPSNGEEGLQIVIDLIATGAFSLVVVDSVAALTPQAEMDGSMEDMQVGAQARMMSKALRKVRESVKDTDTALVFINQVRDKIGFMANGGTTSPGGRALKFYSSVRIELKKMGDIKDKNGESKGTRVKANVLKNKVATPMKTVEYDILHGHGFNNSGSILELAEKYGLVKRSGSWYSKVDLTTGEVADKSFAQGADQVILYMEDNPEWALTLADKVKEIMMPKKQNSVAEVEQTENFDD